MFLPKLGRARSKKTARPREQRLMTLLEERLVKTAIQQVFPDGELDRSRR